MTILDILILTRGQDIFNDILDEVESFLAKFNVVNGSRYDPEESLT